LPEIGDEVQFASIRVRVEAMEDRAIETLLISLEKGGKP